MLRVVLTILNVVLAVTYPLAVWWSLTHTSARNTGLLVMLVLIPGIALRLRGKSRGELWPVLRVPLVVLCVLLLGVLFDDPRFATHVALLAHGQDASAVLAAVFAEATVDLEREVAVLIARRPGGQSVVYPVVETVQENGMCRELVAPAPIDPVVAAHARNIAERIADAIDVTGIMAVELFVARGENPALRPGEVGLDMRYRDFFQGYRKTSLRTAELITAIEFEQPARLVGPNFHH